MTNSLDRNRALTDIVPPNDSPESDDSWMQMAIELAHRGAGAVEPNPMVGCVIVRDGQMLGLGWHEKYGGPHAEVNAIELCGGSAAGATAYVTLEPCCHHGKTPPCTQALIEAGISRVVIGRTDPSEKIAGQGIVALTNAGIEIQIGVMLEETSQLVEPFRKLDSTGFPWVIAKWAMSLDGRIATKTGNSQWITNQESRAIVHQIRGRVDAVIVGIGTALADDPMLNARPSGARVATRIVLDSNARLPLDSQLVQTAQEFPVMVVVGPNANEQNCDSLSRAGVEIWRSESDDADQRVGLLLAELGRRKMTNVLFEGGGQVLGSLHQHDLIDEVHVFIAPKFIGGNESPGPIGGLGRELVSNASQLRSIAVRELAGDIYINGRFR